MFSLFNALNNNNYIKYNKYNNKINNIKQPSNFTQSYYSYSNINGQINWEHKILKNDENMIQMKSNINGQIKEYKKKHSNNK